MHQHETASASLGGHTCAAGVTLQGRFRFQGLQRPCMLATCHFCRSTDVPLHSFKSHGRGGCLSVSMACAGDVDAGGASTSGNSPTYAPHSNATTPRQSSQEVAPPPVWEPKVAAGQCVQLLKCEVLMSMITSPSTIAVFRHQCTSDYCVLGHQVRTGSCSVDDSWGIDSLS